MTCDGPHPIDDEPTEPEERDGSRRDWPDDADAPALASPHGHVPVLPAECLELLAPGIGETVVDCTAGRGGHAVLLAQAVGPTGRIVLLDVDAENLAYAAERVRRESGCEPLAIHTTFAGVEGALRTLRGQTGLKADVVLADLGFSSTQMDDPGRGFSFMADGPLDMRLDLSAGPTSGPTAAELLRTLPERSLADLIFRLGEEPLARRIARKVVEVRGREPIESTAHLARLVREAYGSRAHQSRLHPATRTFMALRIAVNDELGALRSLLQAVRSGAQAAARDADDGWLRRGARVGIIAFHSLEDRLVKREFADMSSQGLVEVRTRKPVVSCDAETAANPRSRSAKLRVVRVAMAGIPVEDPDSVGRSPTGE
jgi:16S rRNA (cytosine1402-N4)-methyltransferase